MKISEDKMLINQIPQVHFLLLHPIQNLNFFLACIEPNGNITNGITRTHTDSIQFTRRINADGTTNETKTGIKFNSFGGHDAWPSDRYLNIWICNLSNGLLGYAQFPGIGQTNTDGVVIMYNCFGRTGTLDPIYNKGRTATHEIGHWLNLRHIWGDDDNGNGACTSNECSGTDNVSDTPNQGERNYGCPTFPKTDCCNSTSPGVMFMNFMDYSDDVCMNMFTVGQASRMKALFASGGFRECFILNPVINNWCQSLINYSISPVVCSTGNTFTINKVPENGTVSWSCSSNITFDNQPGNPKIFTANGTGVGTITATINTNCGSVTLPAKTVWVGPPTAPLDIFGIQNGWEFWSETNYDFTVNSAYVQNASQYNWVVRGGSIVAGQGTPTITYKTAKVAPGAQKTFDVSVKVGNTCGWGPYLMRSGYVNPPPGSSMFIVYPNPATTEVTVSVEADVSAKMATGSATENVEIKALDFYDMYGNRLKAEIYGKGQQSARVNVSGFQKGTYWIIVNKGGEMEEKHALVVE